MKDRAGRAYEVAAEAFRARLEKERPDDERELRRVEPGEIVEVLGGYDRIGSVLSATGVPFTTVSPNQLEQLDWNRVKALFVNCPGHIGATEIEIIRDWVRAGGTLLTTDWALKHVLERAFPGRVRHNGATTPDCVVEVDRVAEDPLLDGFLEDGRKPLWWLEGASYPIEILDRENVRVLARSAEVERNWGSDPVVVRWSEQEGDVVHMMSHLYLQRAETRGARDRMSAQQFFEQSGFDSRTASILGARAADLNAAELKAAYSSAGLAMNLVARAKQKSRQ